MVFGVCVLGVGALYLVPGVQPSPAQLSGARTARPTDSRGAQPVAYLSPVNADQPDPPSSDQPGPGSDDSTAGSADGLRATRAADRWQPDHSGRAGATAGRPADRSDEEAPSVVSELSFPTVTRERLTICWPAASDNVRVSAYRIWLNGYHVADTTSL